MRLPIAAAVALALLATPAAAQRLNTTRIDVREGPSGTRCGFQAFPEMTLDDASARGFKAATWRKAANEDAAAILQLVFGPAKDTWRAPSFILIAFAVPATAVPNPKAVASGRLSIDGRAPFTLAYEMLGNKLVFTHQQDVGAFGNTLIASRTATLEIRSSARKTLRRYSWNTETLAEAAETIEVASWSCTGPQ
ncbi:MAG: hypothetical protein V4574_14865 [Pseudomonadota bacterium]